MNLKEISNYRLVSQQIEKSNFCSPKEIVSWMGAMQAQDFNMAKWALGIRLPGGTEAMVEEALSKGEILRTHLLRPTWHFVSAEDIYWILDLTAPHVLSSEKTRLKQLALDEEVIKKCKNIVEKELVGGKQFTRNELMASLEKNGISTEGQRAAHIMFKLELDGLVCSGALKGKQQTYALLEERVPKANSLGREEALARLVKRYFTSHAPATLYDFSWWSGLTVKDAKKGMDMVKENFVEVKSENNIFYLPSSYSFPPVEKSGTYLIPAFDEFLISYKDRSASMPSEYFSKSISNNGIFWPIVVIDGQVKGVWKRTIKKDKVLVEIDFFRKTEKFSKRAIENEAKRFGEFLGLRSEILIPL